MPRYGHKNNPDEHDDLFYCSSCESSLLVSGIDSEDGKIKFVCPDPDCEEVADAIAAETTIEEAVVEPPRIANSNVIPEVRKISQREALSFRPKGLRQRRARGG